MAEIKCKNLSLGYKNNVLINNLNFEINKGDYLCIVGKNGARKDYPYENYPALAASFIG